MSGERTASGVVDIGDALRQRCLAGLGAAAAALAGRDIRSVCATFAFWQSEARRAWPWLAGLCYEALSPLGVEFPANDPDAVALGRLLVAAETDPAAVRGALASREEAPDSAATGAHEAGAALRRRRLDAAVDRFWSELADAASSLHDAVVARDRPAADRVISRTRRRLEDIAEEIEGLAEDVAARAAGPVLPPWASRVPDGDDAAEEAADDDADATQALAPSAAADATQALLPADPDATGPLAPPEELLQVEDATGPAAGSWTSPAPAPPSRGAVAQRTGPGAASRPAGARRPVPAPPPDGGLEQWAPIAFVVLALLAAVIVLLTVGPAS